ncbi:MAG TPA: KTSC domain-containing protein [Verrucomicrobiae bacterium]|nr:KTSC domain-containing protein [Verrucomicrobiae bacterium]
MHRNPVVSSNIVSVGYEPSSQTLEIEFGSGGVYQYYNVPESIYQELLGASSKGRFFASQIKDRFPYARV